MLDIKYLGINKGDLNMITAKQAREMSFMSNIEKEIHKAIKAGKFFVRLNGLTDD